ncbi:hypothetical protein M2171_005170 [Bradyrhizobium japonicum USDA 38]|uniref:hypothetical protein n=1 Tax=Bradyrhizobium japonicum TaxID=375 RepID=UPI0004111225|nr:hypothetical protein [Bradyrhizobium japonicum]MCS3896037.1 hypothetical protein [Bradyrhizobium japonicum USDA 38]MCS3948551.1 hypothetical protein [Bradyrhizobium japonicum]
MLAWYSLLILMADTLQVIDMRLRQIAAGTSTADEMFLMVTEKLDAAAEARTIFIRGGDCGDVLDHYKKIIAGNVERLSAGKMVGPA